MKKILIIITLFIMLITGGENKETFSLLNYFSGEYYSYTTSAINSSSVNLGACYMTSTPAETHCIGESVKVNNLEPISAIKTLKAEIVKAEMLQNGAVIFYCYSPNIKSSVSAFNKKVNIQLAYYEDYSIIGWPLILSSF